MNIKFNDTEIQLETDLLIDVLTMHGLAEKTGIAVAINQTVVSRSNWDVTKLNENDAVLVITATAGG
jgi:sulfur carrier protein